MKKFIWALLCLVSNAVLSQSDYREGFIVTQNNDTINGLIDFKESSGQYIKCKFRRIRDEKVQTFEPRDLKEYWFVNDKHFVSQQVQLNEETQNVFLEYLVKGHISLYSDSINYFVQKDRDSLIHLENEKFEIKDGNKTYSKNSNRHVAILTYMMRDCPEVKNEIRQIKLTEKRLTLLIEKYNHCIGVEPVSFKQKKEWAEVRIIPSIGVNSSTKNYILMVGDRGYTKTFPSSMSVYGGVNFDLLFPRIHERFFLNSGLFYLSTSYKERGTQYFDNLGTNTDYTVDYYAREDLSQLKIPFGMGYYFPTRKVTPILRTGFTANILLNHSSYTLTEYERGGRYYSIESIDPYGFQGTEIAYWIGIGLQTKLSDRLNSLIDIRYEMGVVQNLQLMFGIAL